MGRKEREMLYFAGFFFSHWACIETMFPSLCDVLLLVGVMGWDWEWKWSR